VFTPLARKTSKGALQNQDLFFKDFFFAISAPNMSGSGTFLGGYLKTT
jgi:hypothetical protein